MMLKNTTSANETILQPDSLQRHLFMYTGAAVMDR